MAAFSGSTLPAGWLLCDGSAVSRDTYAALFSIIGTTYGAGDGNITFNLPNLTDKFIQGSSTAGTEKSAGLPNITGDMTLRGFNIQWPTLAGDVHGLVSAYNQVGDSVATIADKTSGTPTKVYFNASNSNSIYGNSQTVQPPAVTMQYAIYSGIVGKKLWLRTI